MKWKELIGKHLVGIMDVSSDAVGNPEAELLFLIRDGETEKYLVACSKNQDYSWYDNWRLEDAEKIPSKLNDTYKTINSDILAVDFEGDEGEDGTVTADMAKWIAAVGQGTWGATDGVPYFFLKISTPAKIIRLGTTYSDCHYPFVNWDMIEKSSTFKEEKS